jgi:lysophospholipid acyltransferase (LPLAT)-like uncharacterized protein
MIKKLWISLASNLLYLLSISVNSTLRFKFVGYEQIDQLKKDNNPLIFVFWHQISFPFFYLYRHTKLCIMPIDTIHGKILSRFAKKYGFNVLPYHVGDNSLENTKCLIRIIKTIKSGTNLALAVDGPPGKLEIYKAKPGALFLAQKSQANLIPVGTHFSAKLIVPFRWDKYIIPLPFSQVTIQFEDPFQINKDLSVDQIEQMTTLLEEKINSAMHKANSIR